MSNMPMIPPGRRKGVALLLASNYVGQPHELAGPLCDVERMRRCIPPGFELHTCLGRGLTRGGLLDGRRVAMAAARRGELFIEYYSGHGGFAHLRMPNGRFVARRYLVTEDEPVLDVELWPEDGELARRGVGHVKIFDCCHAQGLTRAAVQERPLGLAIKQLAPIVLEWPRQLDVESSDDFRHDVPERLVRISATSPHLPAYEVIDEDGVPGGILTIELHRALHGAPQPRSVRDTMVAVYAAMRANRRLLLQRPRSEGPLGQLLFEPTDVCASS